LQIIKGTEALQTDKDTEDRVVPAVVDLVVTMVEDITRRLGQMEGIGFSPRGERKEKKRKEKKRKEKKRKEKKRKSTPVIFLRLNLKLKKVV
jgi:hypothetical protein